MKRNNPPIKPMKQIEETYLYYLRNLPNADKNLHPFLVRLNL